MATTPAIRAFIALPPDESTRERLSSWQNELKKHASTSVKTRFTPDDHWHLTLKFLGNIEPDTALAVARALTEVTCDEAAISTRIDALAAFPRKRHARALVAKVDDSSGRLSSLQRRVESALTAFGVPAEARAFIPHITLARFGVPTDASAFMSINREPFAITFNACCLYQSTLGRDGSRYTVLFRKQLA
jgi:2'-5' RNA ligase